MQATKTDKQTKLENAIKLWNKLKIERVNFKFDCGGDNMGDTEITIFDAKDNEITNSEIETYFDDATYDNVEFYVDSDGHYQGEAGDVNITLNDYGDDFDYSKSAQSEWSESVSSVGKLKVTKSEAKFITDRLDNINGSSDSGCAFNFKGEFILTDKEEIILKTLEDKINDFTGWFEPDDIGGEESELGEWYTFTTNEDNEELKIVDNVLHISINNQATVYRDSE